jgi:CRISPR/Cas system-associated exonuclease Cas4 (RecB family)
MPGASLQKALSYSSFHTYEDCPQRWKFLYVDEIPEEARSYFSFGRTMHLTLESFVSPLVLPVGRSHRQLKLSEFTETKPRSPMTLEELLAQYERHWIREGYGSESEERKYFLVGKDLLTRYHSIFTSAPPRPVAVEKDLKGSVDGVPLHGIIDRIDLTKRGGLEVLDYKTSRELSMRDANSSDQLTFYQLLVEQNYEQPVEALVLYHLRSLTPLASPPRKHPEIANLSRRVAEVAGGITSQSFEPRVGPHCARCEFRKMCPAFSRA